MKKYRYHITILGYYRNSDTTKQLTIDCDGIQYSRAGVYEFINKTEDPIPALSATWYEKLALSICLSGVLVIGFASGIYQYVASLL